MNKAVDMRKDDLKVVQFRAKLITDVVQATLQSREDYDRFGEMSFIEFAEQSTLSVLSTALIKIFHIPMDCLLGPQLLR